MVGRKTAHTAGFSLICINVKKRVRVCVRVCGLNGRLSDLMDIADMIIGYLLWFFTKRILKVSPLVGGGGI